MSSGARPRSCNIHSIKTPQISHAPTPEAYTTYTKNYAIRISQLQWYFLHRTRRECERRSRELTYPQVQTLHQRLANEKFAKREEKKKGKPEGVLKTKAEKKKSKLQGPLFSAFTSFPTTPSQLLICDSFRRFRRVRGFGVRVCEVALVVLCGEPGREEVNAQRRTGFKTTSRGRGR